MIIYYFILHNVMKHLRQDNFVRQSNPCSSQFWRLRSPGGAGVCWNLVRVFLLEPDVMVVITMCNRENKPGRGDGEKEREVTFKIEPSFIITQ